MSDLDKENVRFQKEWDERVQYIEAALAKSGNTYKVDDVFELVCAGLAHFEPLEDGAAIFLYHQYPQRKMLRIWLAGGVLPDHLEQVCSQPTWNKSWTLPKNTPTDYAATELNWKVEKGGNGY